MMRYPNRISGQLGMLMVVVVILFNLIATASLLLLHHLHRQNDPAGPIGELPPPIFSTAPPPDCVRPPPPGPPPGPTIPIGPIIVSLGFLTTSIGILAIWAARTLVAPLQSFAEAAERFSAETDGAELEERGPIEMRRLAQALNAMRRRIARLMAERTRMLAAVSHDLRTPITRLLLRAEFIDDDIERRRMIADLNHMETLVKGALTLLRDGASSEPLIVADLPSLLQTLCDHFADLGHDIPCQCPPRLAVRMRPHDLSRAVRNLIENALRYGKEPRVQLLRSDGGHALIQVIDSGPGIPIAERESVFATFARGEVARTMTQTDGFGLGLGIARTIAHDHGGELTLRDREPTGLVAELSLPLIADR